VTENRAFGGSGASAARWLAEQPGWWEGHYLEAVDHIVEFLAGDGLAFDGKRILDVGCGDGIISLGLATRTTARMVTGLDLEPVDVDYLTTRASERGVDANRPNLTFGVSSENDLGLPDDSLDVVVAWSVFEHVRDVPGLLCEIRRVLVDDGLLFIQIWPLYFSEHGSHLWPWIDEPFHHLRRDHEDIASQVRRQAESPELAAAALDLYASCNRLTLDDLGAAVHDAGFYLAKVETDRVAVHIPPELQKMPLSLLTTAGVTLLAVKSAAATDQPRTIRPPE
jgi:ubiquinone/menaquinone biosynthesis C-methylase UbiE